LNQYYFKKKNVPAIERALVFLPISYAFLFYLAFELSCASPFSSESARKTFHGVGQATFFGDVICSDKKFLGLFYYFLKIQCFCLNLPWRQH